MSGGSSSKNNDNTDEAFVNGGDYTRSLLRAHPNATTAQRLALFDGVLDGLGSIHADEKAQIASNYGNKLQEKDAAHATALKNMNKEINEWKEQATAGATELKKKEDAHTAVLEKMNKEINEWKEKATAGASTINKFHVRVAEDAAKISKLQADKEEWTAEKERMTVRITNLTGQVNAKDEKVRRLKKGGKAEKVKCNILENFAKEQEIQEKKDAEELKRIIEKQKEEKAARKLAVEREMRKRRESTDSTVSGSSSA